MKILQVVHSLPFLNQAGTEIYSYDLSLGLSKRHKVYIFSRTCDIKQKEYQITEKNIGPIKIYLINNTFKYCNSFEMYYRNNTIDKKFGELLDEIMPDVVHVQHLIFLSTTIITEIKKRGIPIVLTLHDYWLICPQWHYLKKDFTICDNRDISLCVGCLSDQFGIQKLPKRIYLIFRNIMSNFFMSIFKNAYLNLARIYMDSQEMLKKIEARRNHIKELCSKVDLFIAPSQFLKNTFVGFGIPEYKIKIAPSGINIELFKDFKRKKSGIIRFAFIGTLLPAKGIDILINAFNDIKDTRAELKVYGRLFPYKGFEYYPRYIKRLTKNKNIRFMGSFEHKNIPKIFTEIDVLVVPSIWNENLPLVILEAFATRTLAIASRIGGIPELIRDKENGLLFCANDKNDLFMRLKEIIEEPALLERLRGNIKPPIDIEVNAKTLENIYENLIPTF